MVVNKQGELTSRQIVILVLSVIGFGIVLLALFLVNFGGYSDSELCKLSVLTRASAGEAGGSLQQTIPLKCKTAKICLYEGIFTQGACNEQFAGEKNVEYIRLSGGTSDVDVIEAISANAMYDCWNMMGEGKLDLFRNFFGSQSAQCVVCSRVAIDQRYINDHKEIMGSVDVDNYLRKTQIPGQSLTYLQAFTDKGVNSYSSFDKSAFDKVITDEKISDFSYEGNKNYDMAYIFSQIKSETYGSVFSKLALIGGAGAAATFVSPIGGQATKLLFTPAGATIALAAAVGVSAYAGYETYQGQKASGAYCGKFVGKNGDESGCSIVQAVHYNFNDVNKVCGEIQGEL